MKVLEIKQDNVQYRLQDNELVCCHTSVTIEEACCSISGSSGYIECGCGGYDSVICDNPDCTGIDDFEVETLLERPMGGGSDCE